MEINVERIDKMAKSRSYLDEDLTVTLTVTTDKTERRKKTFGDIKKMLKVLKFFRLKADLGPPFIETNKSTGGIPV